MIKEIDLGAGIGAAFTGRPGGVSGAPYDALNLSGAVGDTAAAVTENRRRAATELGLPPGQVVWMRQIHGADVAFVTGPASGPTSGAGTGAESPFGPGPAAPTSGREPAPAAEGHGSPAALQVDGIVTTEPGLALAVLVADCAPVLLADPVAGVIGAAHSGRPGTAAGVVPAVLGEMRARGADPARIFAAIGPMVCGACYEVPGELRDEVAAVVPETYATTRRGTPGLDLAAGIVAQLRAFGVTRIRRDPRCTMETSDLFSYRRDGRTGRFAGFVWLPARR